MYVIYKRYTAESREETVRQVTQRGYSVAEVSGRLGGLTRSLYEWIGVSKQAPKDKASQADVARLNRSMQYLNSNYIEEGVEYGIGTEH